MTAPGGFSSGDVLTAADMNALAGGVMGYTRNTSPPALTTSEQDLVTITFTAVSGRLYLATAAFVSFGYDNSGVLTGKIYADSTRIAEEVFPVPNTTIDYAGATISGYFTGSGSVTVDLRANVFGAASGASISTTGNIDPYLLIMDVGPS